MKNSPQKQGLSVRRGKSVKRGEPPLFASSDRRERINPAVAAGLGLLKRLFRQAETQAVFLIVVGGDVEEVFVDLQFILFV